MLITVSYLWMALHFGDVRFSWWLGLLAIVIDCVLGTPLIKDNQNKRGK